MAGNKLNRRDAMRMMLMSGAGASLLKYDPTVILKPQNYTSVDAVQNMLLAFKGGPAYDRVYGAFAQEASNDIVFVNVKFYMGMNGNYLMKIGNNSIMNKAPNAGQFLRQAGFDSRATRPKHMQASLNGYFSNLLYSGTIDGLARSNTNVIAGTANEIAASAAEADAMLQDYSVFGSTGLGGIGQHNQQTFNINFSNNPGSEGFGCMNYLLESQGILKSPMGVVALGGRNRVISNTAGTAAQGVTTSVFNQGVAALTSDAYVKKSEETNMALLFDTMAGPKAKEATEMRERVRESILDLRSKVAGFSEVESLEESAWMPGVTAASNDRTSASLAYFGLAGRAAATGLYTNFAIGINTIDLNGQNMDINQVGTLNAIDAIQQTGIGLHMLIKRLKAANKSYVIQIESELSRNLQMGDSGVLSAVTIVGGPKFRNYQSDFLAPTQLNGTDTNAQAAAFAAGKAVTSSGGEVGQGSVNKDMQRLGVAQIIAEATGTTEKVEELGRNRLVFTKS
ncbi:MAG: hypothetical protein RJB13_200 [Pseudomonadota bacterium]